MAACAGEVFSVQPSVNPQLSRCWSQLQSVGCSPCRATGVVSGCSASATVALVGVAAIFANRQRRQRRLRGRPAEGERVASLGSVVRVAEEAGDGRGLRLVATADARPGEQVLHE
ncbi:unnamed protein product, partial [Polarella glacialis]